MTDPFRTPAGAPVGSIGFPFVPQGGFVQSVTGGAGITVTGPSNAPVVSTSGGAPITSITAGTGISVTGPATTPTISTAGGAPITSITAGTGLSSTGGTTPTMSIAPTISAATKALGNGSITYNAEGQLTSVTAEALGPANGFWNSNGTTNAFRALNVDASTVTGNGVSSALAVKIPANFGAFVAGASNGAGDNNTYAANYTLAIVEIGTGAIYFGTKLQFTMGTNKVVNLNLGLQQLPSVGCLGISNIQNTGFGQAEILNVTQNGSAQSVNLTNTLTANFTSGNTYWISFAFFAY